MSVKLTTTYWNLKKLTKRYRVIQGSMSSSKTFSILISLFERAITQPNSRITVITSTYPLLKDGVISDMRAIYNDAGLSFSKYFNVSSKDLAFDNGSVIQFRNLDSLDTNAGKGSRRDILFINEANRCSYDALDSFIVRTNDYIIMDFNADLEFWAHEKYVNSQREDVDFIILTYKDNELCPIGEKELIENRIRLSKEDDAPQSIKNWVNVYAYGNIGSYSERQIYEYQIKDIPDSAKRINSGMDWGKNPDRTALVDLYVDGADLYADEIFCLNNLEAEKITGSERMSIVDQMELIKFPKGVLIIGDSAGRVEIQDLRKHGYNIIGVKKAKGSIINGINKVRSYRLFITPTSPNLKKDLDQLSWKVDKNGTIIPEMENHEGDCVVCIRYSMLSYHS